MTLGTSYTLHLHSDWWKEFLRSSSEIFAIGFKYRNLKLRHFRIGVVNVKRHGHGVSLVKQKGDIPFDPGDMEAM